MAATTLVTIEIRTNRELTSVEAWKAAERIVDHLSACKQFLTELGTDPDIVDYWVNDQKED